MQMPQVVLVSFRLLLMFSWCYLTFLKPPFTFYLLGERGVGVGVFWECSIPLISPHLVENGFVTFLKLLATDSNSESIYWSLILLKWIQIWDTLLSSILEKKGLQMVPSCDLLGGFLPVSWFASSKLVGFADSGIIHLFMALLLAISRTILQRQW